MLAAEAALTLKRRVEYQESIERVYWEHRLWPKENPNSKPALEAVISREDLREKVEAVLGKSAALTSLGRPISFHQLQAEMNRMARETKRPEMLKELFAALGNDPYVIAECLLHTAISPTTRP